jgi:hypothetical protein
MKSTPVLPPRKKDWKPGTHQVGLFIRFPDGAVIEISAFDTHEDEKNAALELLRLMTRATAERNGVKAP